MLPDGSSELDGRATLHKNVPAGLGAKLELRLVTLRSGEALQEVGVDELLGP